MLNKVKIKQRNTKTLKSSGKLIIKVLTRSLMFGKFVKVLSGLKTLIVRNALRLLIPGLNSSKAPVSTITKSIMFQESLK